MTIAPYTPGIMHILQQAAEELTKADVKTNIADNLDMLRWKKLVWNVPFNGLSVVLNTTCDKIVGNSDTCDLSKAIMLEIIAAAGANGCTIDATFADKMIELTKNMVPYAPSMKVDFDNNRELEVEFIYSRPVRYGTAKGIKMPKTSELEAKLKAISSRR